MLLMPNKLQNRNFYFNSLFISYLIIIAVLVAFGLSLVFRYLNTSYHYTFDSISNTIQSVTTEVEGRLTSINSIPIELHMDSIITGNAQREVLSPNKKYNWVEIIKKLHNYEVSNSFIGSIYLYFPSQSSIVSSKALYTDREWYSLFINSEESFDDCIDFYFNEENKQGFYVFPSYPMEGSSFFYLDKRILSNDTENWYAVIISFNLNNVFENIYRRKGVETHALMLKDKTGSTLLLGTEKDRSKLQQARDIQTARGFSSDSMSYSIESQVTGLEFTYYFTAPEYLKQYQSSLIIVLILVICLVLFVLFLAHIFTKNIAAPIHRIIDLLSINSDRKVRKMYGDIENSIIQIIDEKNQYSKEYCQQKNEMKENLLFKLLTGALRLPDNENSLTLYDIDFEYSTFSLVLFEIDSFNAEIRQWIEGYLESDNPYMGKIYYAQHLTRLFCLFNFDVNRTEPASSNRIREYFCSLKEKMSDEFGQVNAMIVFSPHIEGLKNTVSACISLQNRLELFAFTKPLKFVHYADRDIVLSAGGLHDNSSLEAYVNCLNVEDYEQSYKIIMELINQLRRTDEPLAVIKYKILNLYNITTVYLKEKKPEFYRFILSERHEIYEKMLLPNNLLELKDAYKHFFCLLNSSEENLAETNKENRLSRQFMKIVEDVYTDENIGISEICRRMNISHSYLARQLKKEMGCGAFEYLQKFRIEKSIETMNNMPSLTILQVAKMNGFSDDIVYIRVFKKYKGITPGRYKNSNQSGAI